jgi:dihydroceramidase
MYVMEAEIRPSRRAKEESLKKAAAGLPKDSGNGHANGSLASTLAEQRRQDERDIKILNSMWTMIAMGLAVFLGGFVLWNLDNEYCGKLRRWRREIGLPWGIILEGHGWWYVYSPLPYLQYCICLYSAND